jgi:hypothetical protein
VALIYAIASGTLRRFALDCISRARSALMFVREVCRALAGWAANFPTAFRQGALDFAGTLFAHRQTRESRDTHWYGPGWLMPDQHTHCDELFMICWSDAASSILSAHSASLHVQGIGTLQSDQSTTREPRYPKEEGVIPHSCGKPYNARQVLDLRLD